MTRGYSNGLSGEGRIYNISFPDSHLAGGGRSLLEIAVWQSGRSALLAAL